MKKLLVKSAKQLTLFVYMLFFSMLAIAQDKKVDIDVNTKSDSGNFFTNPIVWVVGGAVFLLLLVALLRNNNNK